MNLPAYAEVQSRLDADAGRERAAESHGTLCGLLCSAAGDLPGAWVHNTLADARRAEEGPEESTRAALEQVYAATLEALEGHQMRFDLLLPGDERPLDERAEALGAWCQGFLYGLAVRGLKPIEELPGELAEILTDLSEIGRAGFAQEETEEEGEEAYAELVEYVRVAVQLVFDECRPPPISPDEGIPPSATVH
jgi:hypothetical protein